MPVVCVKSASLFRKHLQMLKIFVVLSSATNVMSCNAKFRLQKAQKRNWFLRNPQYANGRSKRGKIVWTVWFFGSRYARVPYVFDHLKPCLILTLDL